jgi:hypothetical protein
MMMFYKINNTQLECDQRRDKRKRRSKSCPPIGHRPDCPLLHTGTQAQSARAISLLALVPDNTSLTQVTKPTYFTSTASTTSWRKNQSLLRVLPVNNSITGPKILSKIFGFRLTSSQRDTNANSIERLLRIVSSHRNVLNLRSLPSFLTSYYHIFRLYSSRHKGQLQSPRPLHYSFLKFSRVYTSHPITQRSKEEQS